MRDAIAIDASRADTECFCFRRASGNAITIDLLEVRRFDTSASALLQSSYSSRAFSDSQLAVHFLLSFSAARSGLGGSRTVMQTISARTRDIASA